eukprot:64655-Rhodomonas_salina.3
MACPFGSSGRSASRICLFERRSAGPASPTPCRFTAFNSLPRDSVSSSFTVIVSPPPPSPSLPSPAACARLPPFGAPSRFSPPCFFRFSTSSHDTILLDAVAAASPLLTRDTARRCPSTSSSLSLAVSSSSGIGLATF